MAMTTVADAAPPPPNSTLDLQSGDRMTREEFHRVYEQMPAGFRAELIGGIVFVASPLHIEHGVHHLPLATIFSIYQGHTPGVEAADNATVQLGEKGEPQPDLLLRILPQWGGQSATTPDHYVQGPPELVAEIALSSRAIDLHAKKDDYARYGVLEYLVVCPNERSVRWFDLRKGDEKLAGIDGVIRVGAFPGLWIEVEGLLAVDCKRYLPTLEKGLASAEHAEFVRILEENKKCDEKQRSVPASGGQ